MMSTNDCSSTQASPAPDSAYPHIRPWRERVGPGYELCDEQEAREDENVELRAALFAARRLRCATVDAGANEDAIANSKRIMSLVDDYVQDQSSSRRAALRGALMDEFRQDVTPGELLEIARESGLRAHLIGIGATEARQILAKFVSAIPAGARHVKSPALRAIDQARQKPFIPGGDAPSVWTDLTKDQLSHALKNSHAYEVRTVYVLPAAAGHAAVDSGTSDKQPSSPHLQAQHPNK
jgi:hypothetical protein